MTQTFVGAQVYLPREIANTTVTVADGVIVEIGGPVLGSEISAHGKILAPAIIDVHGDAFERQLVVRFRHLAPIASGSTLTFGTLGFWRL